MARFNACDIMRVSCLTCHLLLIASPTLRVLSRRQLPPLPIHIGVAAYIVTDKGKQSAHCECELSCNPDSYALDRTTADPASLIRGYWALLGSVEQRFID